MSEQLLDTLAYFAIGVVFARWSIRAEMEDRPSSYRNMEDGERGLTVLMLVVLWPLFSGGGLVVYLVRLLGRRFVSDRERR